MHKDWCGKPCCDCQSPCELDKSIPCSPDCECLGPNGETDSLECLWCDARNIYEPPVTCDEVTGYVGQWLERDTSELPTIAVQHLQEAYNACAARMFLDGEASGNLGKKPDFTNHTGDDYPN